MPRRKPLLILPDFEYRLPGYDSTKVIASPGSFNPNCGVLTFNCASVRQYLNVQRMIQLLHTGESDRLKQPPLNSEDILFQTCVSHELRHFHDWLVSFTYFDAARRSIFLGANARETFRWFRAHGTAHAFPLPLINWLLADETSRRDKLKAAEELLGEPGLTVCDLPYFPIERLEEMVPDPDPLRNGFLICARSALAVRTLHAGYVGNTKNPTPFDIFELSAVATQSLTMIDQYGFQTFKDIFENNLAGTYYDRVLDPIDIVTNDGEESIIRGPDVLVLASAMSLWSICGGPEKGAMATESDPAIRFYGLRKVLCDNRREVVSRLHSIDELIEYFDEVMGESPMAVRIANGTEFFRGLAQDAERQCAGEPSDHPSVRALRYFQEMIALREEIHHRVFGDLTFHMRGSFEYGRAHELTLPPIVMDCTQLDPNTLIGDEGAQRLLRNRAGQASMWRCSDRINALRQEVDFVYESDHLMSKIFFDVDFSRSEMGRLSMKEAIETLVGHRCIAIP